MDQNRTVRSIEKLPFYVIAGEFPKNINMEDIIEGEPVGSILPRLKEGEYLYLVDQTSQWGPGLVKLICLT